MYLNLNPFLVLGQMGMVVRYNSLAINECQHTLTTALYPDIDIARLAGIFLGIEARVGLTFQYRRLAPFL